MLKNHFVGFFSNVLGSILLLFKRDIVRFSITILCNSIDIYIIMSLATFLIYKRAIIVLTITCENQKIIKWDLRT